MSEHQEHQEEPVTIKDKRRIDPNTGKVRDVAPSDGASSKTPPTIGVDAATQQDTVDTVKAADTSEWEAKIAELTSDLQRAHADYENFRRRTERDRSSIIEHAKASVITELLVVLDDLDRAESHGDLADSPLSSVADKLRETVKHLGTEKFAEPGDPFDPTLHEAVQHEGTGSYPVIGTVYRQGYKFHDKIIRTAMVVVIDAPQDTDGDIQEVPDQQDTEPAS